MRSSIFLKMSLRRVYSEALGMPSPLLRSASTLGPTHNLFQALLHLRLGYCSERRLAVFMNSNSTRAHLQRERGYRIVALAEPEPH
jgi:hypothetical protein